MGSSRGPFRIGNQIFDGKKFAVIAGPCSVESESQFRETASFVAAKGASFLRGGLFKLRTNPESFQGMGTDAFSLAKKIRKEVSLPLISEVTDTKDIEAMSDVVDVFQVGSRNMHNYALLKELGRQPKPVMLKRGFAGLIQEWLLAAEYVEKAGNSEVILCERGIRTFETATRNTLDLNAVAYVKQNSHLPVIVDPSHGTGASNLVRPLALAAAAVGADGIMVEVHPRPKEALSDGFQALDFEAFSQLMQDLKPVLHAMGRELMTSKSDDIATFKTPRDLHP